jgi:hypothetical protein
VRATITRASMSTLGRRIERNMERTCFGVIDHRPGSASCTTVPHNRGLYYRMFAIAGRIDEFGDRIVYRGGEMAMEGDRSGSEGMPSDVAARLGMIEARLEKPLTEEERNEVRGRIARSIALGVALRAYPLSNADEPEIELAPYRGAE